MTSDRPPSRLAQPFWTGSRIASAVVFLAVLATAATCLRAAPYLLIARLLAPAVAGIACIWFRESAGDYTGRAGPTVITARSSASVLRWPGWLLLLLPIPLILAAS